jgi:hypothetical protein
MMYFLIKLSIDQICIKNNTNIKNIEEYKIFIYYSLC